MASTTIANDLRTQFNARSLDFDPNVDTDAYVTLNPEKSLAAAKAADARIADGTAGLLTGIPIAQKDIFCAEGWLTTCGSKMLSNFVSPYSAHVIEHKGTPIADEELYRRTLMCIRLTAHVCGPSVITQLKAH